MKTINKVFLILLVSLAASALFAQSDPSFGYQTPQTKINTFVQKVEGGGHLTSAVQAADGSYVTISKIDSKSFLVRKIKGSGQKQWERKLTFIPPPPKVFLVSITGIAQTVDGGFVLVGQLGSFGFEERGTAILIKLRPNGTVAWQKTYEGGQSFSGFSSVIATPDGGVIAIGATGEAFSASFSLVVRFAATGDVVWAKSFKRIAGFTVRLPLITSTATADNSFIVAFPTSTNVNNARLNGVDVMKITNSGNVVWEKSLKTGPAFGFQSTGVTANGGVILIGNGPNSNKLKVVVLKANGAFSWNAGYFLKVPGIFQSISSPVQTPDGGYVLTGWTRSDSKSYGFVAKIDSSRKIAFQNTFGGGRTNAESVLATADGGFLLFHSTNPTGLAKFSDLLVLKVNSEGVVPDCGFFHSLGSTARTPFGFLSVSRVDITAPDDLSFEPFDFGLSSVVSNDPVSTVCN